MKIITRLKMIFKNADLVTNIIVIIMLLLAGIQSASAQCPTPPGDPTVYGDESWIGYVYSGLDANNPPQNAFTTTIYRGYLTQPEQFNQNLVNAAPTASTICGTYADSFSMRFRMKKNFPAGYYTFTIGGDDGERLSFDSGTTWAMSDWNYHSYQTTTATFFMSGDYYLVLENYDQGGQSQVSFAYTFCSNYSTAPTSISGTTSICNGSSTTLTAIGGTLASGSVYQWGTGTVGSNAIAGQTSASITVSPTANTTYWVRRVDPVTCGGNTAGVSQAVTVTTAATAPTSISGTTTLCLGNSTTLTATGGTGATYEWGSGSVIGINTISGETSGSITVTPTANTTYWVRRNNSAPCVNTAGVTVNVNVNTPPGDQSSYGSNSWIGYVYATIGTTNPPTDAFTVPYKGYITEPETFNQNWDSGSVSGPNVCGSYDTRFAVKFKMQKNFTPGYYTFTVGGDDGYRFSLDGGATYVLNNWTDHGYTTTSTATLYLSGPMNLVLDFYEQGGLAQVSFNYVACMDFSSAPTGISGTSPLCYGTGGTTLSATGGYAAAGATYQWGTGTVGNNIIAGQTNSTMYINPTATTAYWVRRVDGSPCNMTTGGATQIISVSNPSTNPTSITTPNSNVCLGNSIVLTANGGTLAAGGTYEWGTGYSAGSNTIVGQNASTITISPTATSGYWVRRVDVAPCNTQTPGVNITITVSTPSTAPTSITGVTSICNGGNTNLTANGGTTGTNGTFQWGTGTVGNNIIAGATNATVYINPTTTTTYWVRRVDTAPCTANTTAITQVVTVAQPSTAPTSITGTSSVCSGTSITLTATGGTLATGGSYLWGTGYTVGSNTISGQTAQTLTVTPTTSTVYWVRRVDPAPCNTQTNGATLSVTVATPSVAPASITGPSSLCYTSGGGTLTAVGATVGTNGAYQWGYGTVGQNIQGSTQSTMYINPSVTTTYWVRMVDSAPCTANSAAVTFTVSVNTTSTAPTGISGTTTICNGASTTLTATGGTAGVGSTYQWGFGTNPGDNIINGQTGISMTVNPTATTTYWVRRADGSPCTTTTYGPNVTVTVTNPSTAPTSITGAGSGCPGTAYTLTAIGGTAATGSVYQWGTGATIGSGVINGQTGASITVSPTATTTYWVRRYDGTPCSAYTSGVTTTVTIAAVPGDPTVFGTNTWNVYGYSTGDITLATAVYAGFYTQSTTGFDTTASWPLLGSPSGASNWSGCPVPVDNFTFVYKRRGFPCGSYAIVMSNWDDASEVYINGTLAWNCTSYSGGGACNGNVGTFNLTSTSTIEVRVRENGGNANAAMTLTNNTVASTAPAALSGFVTTCIGTAVTLTASGGTTGTNGVYQWGTGTTGFNIISGEAGTSITVNPSVTTTYWVRRIDSVCGQTTPGLTKTITVSTGTVAGSLSTEMPTICKGTKPGNIFLTGQTGNVVKWQYANDAAFTSGVTDMATAATSLSSEDIGPLAATRYFRAVVQSGSCLVQNTAALQIVVPTAVTYSNGAWSGTPTPTTPVIINSNLALTSNLHVCSCQVKNGVTLTVNSNTNLVVVTTVEVEPTGNFVIEDKGSLVQTEDSATDMGSIKFKRNTTPMKTYDYCYWSAPVQNTTLFQLSPLTTSDKYYRFDPTINNWVSIANGAQTMTPGKGYIVRAPQGWSATNASGGIYSAEFNGIPNNGVIPTTIQKADGTFNLIGNPYPSAIDIDLFLTDPANTNVITGTIYLWTHNTAISSQIPGNWAYNYTADDYAKYNLTGGVKTASTAITGGVAPDGKVAAGQAFFIEANGALANGSYTANFKNNMRVVGHNDTFYRPGLGGTPVHAGVEKNRLWLNISNTHGAYNEALVGYVTGATNDFDNLYDGKIFPAGNVLSMYSISGTDSYSIQGRALPFNANDVIPMGYKTTIAGDFTIAIENFDGLFENQDVFLIDHLMNTTQNLKNGSYGFTSEIGTFNDRFEVRFVNSTLATHSVAFNQDNVIIFAKDKQVSVTASKTIESVVIYDLLGRKLFSADKINALTFKTPQLTSSEQVLIVTATFEGNYKVSRKVLID